MAKNFFQNFGKGPTLKSRLYNLSVDYTLKFYERYVLPQPSKWAAAKDRVGLREIKLREFRDRKKLLNPY